METTVFTGFTAMNSKDIILCLSGDKCQTISVSDSTKQWFDEKISECDAYDKCSINKTSCRYYAERPKDYNVIAGYIDVIKQLRESGKALQISSIWLSDLNLRYPAMSMSPDSLYRYFESQNILCEKLKDLGMRCDIGGIDRKICCVTHDVDGSCVDDAACDIRTKCSRTMTVRI
jgi:hypothetical protein